MYPAKDQEEGDIATVNGEAVALSAVISIADLLAERGLAGKRVAVERNGEIVPRSEHASIELKHGDRIEIVIAVGGG
jgi:sulfur carrier protein